MSIDQRSKPRIIVMIDGGMVTGVYGDNLPDGMIGIDVITVDDDTGDADDDHLKSICGRVRLFAVDTLEQADDALGLDVGRAYMEWGLS